jgi:hypothetical protein
MDLNKHGMKLHARISWTALEGSFNLCLGDELFDMSTSGSSGSKHQFGDAANAT